MEDFTIFIVIGLYWLFSAIKRSSKKQNKGARPKKSVLGSLAERMQEAQRAAEAKLADWEEEQRQVQAAQAQYEAEEPERTPSLGRAELPSHARREARAIARRPEQDTVLSPRPDSGREMQRRLGVEKARRVAAERDRDEALAWVRRIEEGMATVRAAAPEPAASALAPATATARRVSGPARVERREVPSLAKALERLSPLRRAILYAEITGAPASLRPDVGGLGRSGL